MVDEPRETNTGHGGRWTTRGGVTTRDPWTNPELYLKGKGGGVWVRRVEAVPTKTEAADSSLGPNFGEVTEKGE